jgi:hypothetical protein
MPDETPSQRRASVAADRRTALLDAIVVAASVQADRRVWTGSLVV